MRDRQPDALKRLHCRELDGERTGILILNEENIELYFVSYDEFIHVSEDKPTYVITEEGMVASLYANVPGRHSQRSVAIKFGGGHRGRESDEYRSVSQSGFISNLAVIGSDAWHPDDRVRRLSFEVPHTERILRHYEKVRSLGRTSEPSGDDFTLYRVQVGNVALTASYLATYHIDTRSLTDYRPTFSIEFTRGVPLDKIGAHLFCYLSFFSFILGEPMVPAAVRVNRLSFEEMLGGVETGTYVGDHKVVWNWPADEYGTRALALHGAPFVARDDEELAALAAGLAAWVNRSKEWERAYTSMTENFSLRGSISGERLLAAWRWFEELPTTRAERALDDAALENIIQAARDAACLAGHADLDERIRGSLRRLGEETMRDRFARLTGSIRMRLGSDDLLGSLISHLENARSFRGRVAHGYFAARDENEMRRFNKATLAMEALCYLLTARDLPMTEARKQRLWSHPVLEEYQLAYF